LANNIAIRNTIESLYIFGLKVIFLKYDAKAIIVRYIKELIPIG